MNLLNMLWQHFSHLATFRSRAREHDAFAELRTFGDKPLE